MFSKRKIAHVMIDLETLGLETNAVVSQIGVASFITPEETDEHAAMRMFRGNVDIDRQPGRAIDPDCLKWWFRQDRALHAHFNSGLTSPIETLLSLNTHIRTLRVHAEEVWVWGHPASFDVSILLSLYASFGITPEFSWRDGRDFRTLRHLAVETFGEQIVTTENFVIRDWPEDMPLLTHDALYDAVKQATELRTILRLLPVGGLLSFKPETPVPDPSFVPAPNPSPSLSDMTGLGDLTNQCFRVEGVTGGNDTHWQCRRCGRHLTTTAKHPSPFKLHMHREWFDASQVLRDHVSFKATLAEMDAAAAAAEPQPHGYVDQG